MSLHTLSRLGLRVFPPALVYRVARVVGRLAPLESEQAAEYARRLEGTGTCLSRSIAVASRMPNATIKVGISFLRNRPVDLVAHGLPARDVLRAHAWVEVEGQPLAGQQSAGIPLGVFAHEAPEPGSTGRSRYGTD